VAALVPDTGVMPQPDGDLGDRMRGVMEAAFTAGANRVALIGSDLPEISAAHLSSAFEMLNADPSALVLGPAHDGGYYLLAASRVPPVFSGIAWGGPDVLEQTRTRATGLGWAVGLLPALGDVDDVADLRRVCRTCPRSRTAAWARARQVA
jgi:rSAM/selenodomain-associated transferase 1